MNVEMKIGMKMRRRARIRIWLARYLLWAARAEMDAAGVPVRIEVNIDANKIDATKVLKTAGHRP